MATIVQPHARLNAERLFFTCMATVMLAIVFVGFAPTYYLVQWSGAVTVRGVPAIERLTPLVHIHAIVFRHGCFSSSLKQG